MSTEDEENRLKKRTDVTITLDRSSEIDDLQEQLTREKIRAEEAEETLKLISQKEFSEQLKRFHLPEGSTPEDLKTAMSLERKSPPSGGDTTQYWQNELGGKHEDPRQKTDLASVLTDNSKEGLESAIEFLNYKKSHGSESEKAEASRLLSVAEKRVFSKNKTTLDAEFEGDIHALTRHELPINDSMTDEQKAKIEQYNSELRRKRANWKQRE